MRDNDAILKRLKDAETQLDSAQEAAEKTTEIIEESKRTVARARKDAQLLDTSKNKTVRKRGAGKKR
jgi:F0F1-type ATP synthase membrane subunit b/b'